MKKHLLFFLALASSVALHAQWVDGPASNNFLANCSEYGGEVYLSTDEASGDTYVQWTSGDSNGYGPTLQRLTFDGTPQWGADGIRINSHTFSSYSEGIAMCATADNAVVSCFANYDGQTVAVKINADGTYAWGEQGLNLFDGRAFSRTEVIASDDGGVWALGYDYQQLYLQYIKASGSLYPTITVGATGYNVQYGQMTLGVDDIVFLTYEKCGNGFYTDKEIYVVGYTKEGIQVGPEVQLMATQSFQVTYLHYVVPDGLGGGYAYIWHSGIGNSFNTYVFHYDANGFNTISDPNGITVHSDDPENFYLDANATVDPVSHDIILAYIKVDAAFQSNDQIYINRITPTGERVWHEGYLVADNIGVPYGNVRVDAFEDGSGISVIYEKAINNSGYQSTVEAVGLDMEGHQLWTKTLSSNAYNRSMCENSAGFHLGQNIVAWVNGANGGLYGQNIGPDGSMGPIDPVIPVPDCLAPENFEGEYVYNEENQTFGALLTWEAPETQPLWYQLYITMPDGDIIIAEIDPTETEYFHEMTTSATLIYRLIAVYEHCESDYALTPNGLDYVVVDITSIPENADEEIVTITKVYTLNGQLIHNVSEETLVNGVYIIQGMTKDGQNIIKKIVVNR